MSELTSSQKKYLRGLAHGLKPVIQVGKHALTEQVMENIEEALAHHELIKIKFGDHKDQKNEACETINQRLGSERVGVIGHTAILFRQAREPEHRKVKVPN